jgi:hypothetical protein
LTQTNAGLDKLGLAEIEGLAETKTLAKAIEPGPAAIIEALRDGQHRGTPGVAPGAIRALALVQVNAPGVAMVPVPLSHLEPSRIDAIEDWPWLDQDVLRTSRSRQVCMTCHFFRHHPGPDCIPLLTCHLHQGLIAHGEHLTHRCSGWTEDLHRHRGWAPEVA